MRVEIEPRRRKILAIAGALAIASAFVPQTVAEPAQEIDFNRLMNETMQQTPAADRLTLVWWLPEEFWKWSVAQEGSLTEKATEEFLAVLRPYTLFVVLDGTLGPMGGATFRDSEDLRKGVVLVDAAGGEYRPIAADGVSADARNLVTMMKPVLANMMGPMGENMTFFFFPGETKDSKPIARAATKGEFVLKVDDEAFAWRTPLGSVLKVKVCPVDGEEMNGAWTYCPWHGKKLAAKE